MTNRADVWLGSTLPTEQGNTEQRAYDARRLLAARPVWITVVREDPPGTSNTLAPQLVRIEIMQNVRSVEEPHNQWLSISNQYVIVIGHRDHPDYPNTDLKRADKFFHQGRVYEVIEFMDTVPGYLMAQCELKPQ